MAVRKIDFTQKKQATSDTQAALAAMLSRPVAAAGVGQIVPLAIDLLDDYPKQARTFGMRELEELSEDIKQRGITEPIHVRPKGTRYEILAGHRRKTAAAMAGLIEVPCVIDEVDDADADLIFSENVFQRKRLLPSERARAYKIMVEAAAAKTGKKTLPISEVAAAAGTNRKELYRFLRLNLLTDELLQLVDEDAVPFRAGVLLAALSQEQQQLLLEVMAKNALEAISLKQAEKLAAKQQEQHDLGADQMQAILMPPKSPKSPKPPVLRIKFELLQEFFNEEQTPAEIEQEIITALEYYRQHQDGGDIE
jgi:ParB family chromosome partitioning protein